jgi:hypothetical protein
LRRQGEPLRSIAPMIAVAAQVGDHAAQLGDRSI